MLTTVKLVLIVDEDKLQGLHTYGKIMRHEIYRIAGVFQKEKRVFSFPYRYISNQIAWDCKKIVVEQAALLYQKRFRNPKKTLDYSSIWSANTCIIHDEGYLSLKLGENHRKHSLKIPFQLRNEQINVIKNGKVLRITIKERDNSIFAFVHLQMKLIDQEDGFISGLKKQMKAFANDVDF